MNKDQLIVYYVLIMQCEIKCILDDSLSPAAIVRLFVAMSIWINIYNVLCVRCV